jgi:hypothetical protein
MEGLKVKDSEGNVFVIKEITFDNDTMYPNGVKLTNERGSKEISSFDLLYFTIVEG